MLTRISLILIALLCSRAVCRASEADTGGVEFFEAHVRPVLVDQCYSCHSAAAPKLKSGLRLDTRDGLFRGGESGTPTVVAGKPEASLLISALHYEEGGLKMPPKGKLPAAQIADIEAWIKMGAPCPAELPAKSMPATTRPTGMSLADGRKFWSFQPPREQTVPNVPSPNQARNEIDQFILSELGKNGLSMSPQADKHTLIRRATFDLIGLPPSEKEIADFLADGSPDAFAKVVDRLLASPRYGERRGRYWLDVARYADTKGYVFTDERRFAFSYTYRDWVIRSLNEDLPYNQFVIDQIAADQLDLKEDKRPLAALGFLTLGRRFLNSPPDIIDDRIDVVSRGMMGLTVACARCHDHKYDPIPTADYYSLYGVFASSREPDELPLLDPKSPVPESYSKPLQEKQKALHAFQARRDDHFLKELNKPEAVTAYLSAAREAAVLDDAHFPEVAKQHSLNLQILEHWRDYVRKPTTQPATTQPIESAVQLALADPASPAHLKAADVRPLYTDADRKRLRELETDLASFEVTSPDAPPRAMAMEDLPHAVNASILKRGNPATPGEEVPRRFPAILSSDDRKPFTHGSGRLDLAQAVASKDNPLTARVMVNRVWQYHFGNGIVRTPSDFGTRGDRPTHPELLDWLALRFENEDGWSLKKLHRRIMLSAAYQQGSVDSNPDARGKDPENRLLWRQNARRLDFEAMRDSLLVASGQIDFTMGGRGVEIFSEPFVSRRSVYAFIDRQNLPGTLRTFDFASPDSTSGRRFSTSVPQQALFMMNSPFVIEQARKLAARPDIKNIPDPSQRIEKLYQTVLSRAPESAEVKLAIDYIANEEKSNQTKLPGTWQYGYGEFDDSLQHLRSFTPLPSWNGTQWRGGETLPDEKLGWAMLSQVGGHPGDLKHAVVRRWIAPRDCTVAVSGTLEHPATQGDGIRARLVTARDGLLATWIVLHKQAETNLSGMTVRQGDAIDFIVDCGKDGNNGFDGFVWKVSITKLAGVTEAAGDDTGGKWESAADFIGPPARMTAWEKYAQVLLESNEFAFVD